MKLPPLPMIDLARYATLSPELKRRALERHRSGGGSWSYDPARGKSKDAFQATTPLDLAMRETSWPQIAADIIRACSHGSEQRDSNLEVAKLLFDWVSENDIRAVEYSLPSLALGKIAQVRYWENLLFEWRGHRYALFLDHRRGNGLRGKHSDASRFVFSAMHHHVRSIDPSFAGYRMAIFRFPLQDDGTRFVEHCTDDGIEHYSFDQLDAMVADTYRVWREVCEAKRAASATSEPDVETPLETLWRRKS
ncbi:MAG: hypothetical protein ABL889_17815 [Terricaulis sp.]